MMKIRTVYNSFTNIIKKYKTPLIAGGLFISGVKGYSIYQNQQKRIEWNSYGKDVVVLHGFGGKPIPSVSPYVLKVQMFMKMAGIKYEFDTSSLFGAKGRTPWITLNEEDCCDSELILDFLKSKFPNVDLNTHLTAEQKAISRSFQIMVDEHVFWGLVLQRFHHDRGEQLNKCWTVPWHIKLLVPLIARGFIKRSKGQGIGLHSKLEIESIIRKDLEAISLYLGNKKYMMGDKPSEIDCAIFSSMSQFIWVDTNSPYAKMIQDDFGNIGEYCNRVKNNLWADWQECCGK